jgi:hypothetical protein
MKLRVQGIPTDEVERLRNGGPDAHGQAPLERIAGGGRNPCRHCLGLIADGAPMLILAHRPFEAAQPYAETGPIFLHRDACARYEADSLPDWFHFLDPAAVRGYVAEGWIHYETGRVVRGPELTGACHEILAHDAVAYVHVRSKYGCFQCRVDRA